MRNDQIFSLVHINVRSVMSSQGKSLETGLLAAVLSPILQQNTFALLCWSWSWSDEKGYV